MTDQATNDFDFDDWAGLYIENPQEFEARRQAALLIEMMRGSAEQCTSGRELLEAYEARVKGCDSTQRLQVAAEMMADSARQLNTELMLLKQTVEAAVEDARIEDKEES